MNRRPLGSKTEIAPDVWRLQVSASYDQQTGKRRRLTKTVHGNERQADAVLAKLLLEAGKMPETEVTVAQYLDAMWLPHAEKRVRARTVDGYRSIVANHVTPKIGDLPLARLSPFQLDKWLDGVDGSPRTRLHVYRCLSTALNQAVKWRLLDHNPLRAVEPPKVRLERPDTLTAKEAAAYVDAFRGHLLEPVVVLALAAGLRRSELAGLTWADIDFDAGTVTVSRGLHDRAGGVITEDPKSHTSRRVVWLPEAAVAVLRGIRGLGPLVVEDGQPMKPWRISQEYERQVKAAKLRRVALKNLRHTHASLMIEAGVDLYTVSQRLGHSSVAVTQNFYVRPGVKADQTAAAALGGLLAIEAAE